MVGDLNVPVIRTPSGPLERRVLILAPTGNDSLLTHRFLSSANIRSEIVPNISELCSGIQEGCGTLLLAEETLAADTVEPLLKSIAQQPSWSDIPLVLITSGGETSQTRLRRLTTLGPVGNVTMLERPFRPITLLSAIETALRARGKQYQVRDLLKEVQASERQVHSVLASIADGFVAVDAQWRFTYLNAAFIQLITPLFPSAEPLLGQNLWEKFPDFVGTEAEDQFRRAMASQRPSTFELFYTPISTWLEMRVYPAPDALSIYVRDITERKSQQQSLEALTRQLRLVTDHASVYLLQCDRNHRFKFVNHTYALKFAQEPQAIVGAHVKDIIGPKSYGDVRVHMDAALAGNRVEFEHEMVFAGAGPRWMHTVYVPEYAKDGSVVGFVGVINDVTARKQDEIDLMNARDRAVEAARAKDDFLAALSHELRTPLNPVLLIASEAANDPELPPRVREDFETIARNVTLEARLIDDLLDLTRIAHGKMSLDKRAIDLHAVLADALETVAPELREKEQTLNVKLAPTNCHIVGDPARIQQIFWNVLKNAVKFTPLEGTIAVETRCDASWCTISIQDSGIGMTKDEVGRIFDAFSQGNHAQGSGSHRFGGLGLGLAISRMLVDLHSGKISASSEGRDRGSTFTIEFPIAEVPLRPAIIPATRRSNSNYTTNVTFPAGSSVRILVVEDHVATRLSLSKLLVRRGYEVVEAGSVAEGLQRADEAEFDLVVSDIGLPDGDGYSLMEELRDKHGLTGIALSGYGMEQDIARGRLSGFAQHLIKPVSVESLDRVLRVWKEALL